MKKCPQVGIKKERKIKELESQRKILRDHQFKVEFSKHRCFFPFLSLCLSLKINRHILWWGLKKNWSRLKARGARPAFNTCVEFAHWLPVLGKVGRSAECQSQRQWKPVFSVASFLSQVCLCYNKGEALYGYCNLKDKCNKFHVCKSFVRGECKLQKCKRSHQLIHAASLKLLQDQGLNIPSVVNFQIISTYRHEKLHKMLENKGETVRGRQSSIPDVVLTWKHFIG